MTATGPVEVLMPRLGEARSYDVAHSIAGWTGSDAEGAADEVAAAATLCDVALVAWQDPRGMDQPFCRSMDPQVRQVMWASVANTCRPQVRRRTRSVALGEGGSAWVGCALRCPVALLCDVAHRTADRRRAGVGQSPSIRLPGPAPRPAIAPRGRSGNRAG